MDTAVLHVYDIKMTQNSTKIVSKFLYLALSCELYNEPMKEIWLMGESLLTLTLELYSNLDTFAIYVMAIMNKVIITNL